jgi:hypothetical protein
MRSFSSYSFSNWLKLQPIKYLIKYTRNRIVSNLYVAKKSQNTEHFLNECKDLKDKNILLVIAFEQPWVIEWLLKMSKKYVTDAVVLVFDNSRDKSKKGEIKKVCHTQNTLYLQLPENNTTHVNRSHSLAMQWIFENIVQAIQPKSFAYIDHDLIPVKKTSIAERLGNQDFYGWLKTGLVRRNPDSWSLWAGYCIYDYDSVRNKKLYFMYDFPQGLDTGGGNYEVLYRNYNKDKMQFSNISIAEVQVPNIGLVRDIMLIDDNWYHIGSVGYNDNFVSKKDYCLSLSKLIDSGIEWDELVVSQRTAQ